MSMSNIQERAASLATPKEGRQDAGLLFTVYRNSAELFLTGFAELADKKIGSFEDAAGGDARDAFALALFCVSIKGVAVLADLALMCVPTMVVFTMAVALCWKIGISLTEKDGKIQSFVREKLYKLFPQMRPKSSMEKLTTSVKTVAGKLSEFVGLSPKLSQWQLFQKNVSEISGMVKQYVNESWATLGGTDVEQVVQIAKEILAIFLSMIVLYVATTCLFSALGGLHFFNGLIVVSIPLTIYSGSHFLFGPSAKGFIPVVARLVGKVYHAATRVFETLVAVLLPVMVRVVEACDFIKPRLHRASCKVWEKMQEVLDYDTLR